MSATDAVSVAALPSDVPPLGTALLQDRLAGLSDHLNPILIKEARQALKSRTFAVTFISVLLLAWAWSIFGIALQAPGIYYAPSGSYMLSGYLFILTVPLIVVVPFAAFRSMAAEREDGTFELVSITDLRPWQLVTGKLASAMLQILIYLSALTPCVAFTYFLRGIDIFMIITLLVAVLLESLLLSALGLVMAALTRPQRMQTAAAVALLLLLAGAAVLTCTAEFTALASGATLPVRDLSTWIVALAVLSLWACGLWLLVLAAAAAVTFASDNRATMLRIATLATHAVWFGWFTWAWQLADQTADLVYIYLIPMTIFWWFCGSCIAGERTVLTPRVRRSLPQTTLGKLFGMLFFPGRGLGYFFVAGNVLTMACLSALIASLSETGRDEDVITTAILCSGYVIAFVGVTNLLLRLSARARREGPGLGLFTGATLLVFAVLFPYSIQLSYPKTFGTDYSYIELSNVVWTLFESIDGDIGLTPVSANPLFIVPYLVATFALVVMFLNLIGASREMNLERLAAPQRVTEDIAAKLPVSAPDTSVSQSPWDES